jgi:SAM-dependent methyltransferase
MDGSLEASYDEFPRIEEAFARALDEGLEPRGPDVVYEVAGALGLPAGAKALDVGCGEGRDVVALARRLGWSVVGVDPVRRNLEVARSEAGPLPVGVGTMEALPLPDRAVDIVWCREVLSLVRDLTAAFAEVHRVLRPGGRVMVVQVCRTERLAAEEATGVLAFLGDHPSFDELRSAGEAAGLHVDERIVLGSEGGEWGEERSGTASRRLLHTARLLRDPDRYVARFGRTNYEIMLGDCLWHVYRMIGKLSGSVYVLSRPA